MRTKPPAATLRYSDNSVQVNLSRSSARSIRRKTRSASFAAIPWNNQTICANSGLQQQYRALQKDAGMCREGILHVPSHPGSTTRKRKNKSGCDCTFSVSHSTTTLDRSSVHTLSAVKTKPSSTKAFSQPSASRGSSPASASACAEVAGLALRYTCAG